MVGRCLAVGDIDNMIGWDRCKFPVTGGSGLLGWDIQLLRLVVGASKLKIKRDHK